VTSDRSQAAVEASTDSSRWTPTAPPTPYYADDLVTIYHGDALDVLSRLMGRLLIVTDPPYGIGLANHGHANFRRRRVSWEIAGDHDQTLGQSAIDLAASLDWPTIAFAHPMRPWSGTWRQHLVWDKGGAFGGGGDPLTCWKQTWELIQVSRTGELSGPRDSAVLRFQPDKADYALHPSPKPVELLRYLIGKVADLPVVDPFMGLGSAVRAAKDLGRRAIGIEIEERYCEIAAQRCSQEVLGLVG
jgi:DNA modification methylase